MSKFQLRITTYRGVDYAAVHFYGTVRIPPERTSNGLEDIEYMEHRSTRWGHKESKYITSRFDTPQQVVAAAKKWFLKTDSAKPGDKLTVWRGYLCRGLQYGDRSPIGY